jgi:hypothetical protein
MLSPTKANDIHLEAAGGVAGTFLGTVVSRRLAQYKGRLNILFAGLVLAVALYMLWQSWQALTG